MNRATTGPGLGAAMEARLRRRTIWIATTVLVLATAHFADHVFRGRLVVSRKLNPTWDHSGWPFEARLSPFTVSLVVVYVLLLCGLTLTLRGRMAAGYWLLTAVTLGGIVTVVHFVPGPRTETPRVIHDTYPFPVAGVIAVAVTFAIVLALIAMAAHAVDVRRQSGRWR
jgi:hypothetical protein